jgi:hypothetical protein
MRISLIAALLLVTAGPAHADVARDALADIVKCADIADAAKRLECFDAAMVRGKAALAAPPPAAPVAKEKSLLDWFGFSKPEQAVTKPEDFGKPAPAPAAGTNEITQISSPVLEFAKTARGKALFVLENGQVWRQLDGDTQDVQPPAPGTTMKVTVEVGFLGSYNLTIEGRKYIVKVNRLK